jgi:pimeloyl-ACP methyl ester carboxylesterase
MPPSRSPEPTPPVPLNGVHRLHDERWSTAAGRPVRMLTAGGVVADRPQVVLVPGLGSVGYLLELLHACGGWTRATLMDLPGFGHRRTAALPADLNSLTDTLTAVLEQLPGPPVVVAGHSTGAQLALRAALRAPERLHGLVLIGPTFEPRARRPTALLARHLRTSAFEPPRAAALHPARLPARRAALRPVRPLRPRRPSGGPHCLCRGAGAGRPRPPRPLQLHAVGPGARRRRTAGTSPHPARRPRRPLQPPGRGRSGHRRGVQRTIRRLIPAAGSPPPTGHGPA